MMTRRTWLIALAVLAVALVAGAGASPPKDAIVIGLLAEPVTMDPPQITDLNSARVTKRIPLRAEKKHSLFAEFYNLLDHANFANQYFGNAFSPATYNKPKAYCARQAIVITCSTPS